MDWLDALDEAAAADCVSEAAREALLDLASWLETEGVGGWRPQRGTLSPGSTEPSAVPTKPPPAERKSDREVDREALWMRWVQLWAARATPLGAKDAEALDAVLDAGFTPQQVARWLCLVREEPLLLPGKRAKVPALRSLLRNHRRMRQALGLPEPGTWLTPFGDAWAAQYGGVMPYGVAARALKPLCVKFGAERVLTAFRRYLARTSGVYASVPRFASTFGEWDGPSHAATDAPVRVTLS